MRSLDPWVPPPRPVLRTLQGRYTRLEPLDPLRHGEALYAASMAPGAEARFRYLFESPQPRAGFDAWLAGAVQGSERLFFAVIDAHGNRCEGRQALMRIEPAHGVLEIGSILWGPAIARTRVATESLYLTAGHVFDELGYRRFEWKCHAANEPSRRAALRFGFQFEGIFRQHMVHKGQNRDTAWFAMTDADWQRLRPGYERWLAPDNFDPAGRQRSRLADCLNDP